MRFLLIHGMVKIHHSTFQKASYTTGDQFFCRSDPMILQSTHWDSLREVFQHRFVGWWATRRKHCSFTPLKNQRLEPPVTTWNCCSTLEAKTPNLKIINSSSFVGFASYSMNCLADFVKLNTMETTELNDQPMWILDMMAWDRISILHCEMAASVDSCSVLKTMPNTVP